RALLGRRPRPHHPTARRAPRRRGRRAAARLRRGRGPRLRPRVLRQRPRHVPECLVMMVLVTGGSGFIGRRLCDALLARGHTVMVVSRDPGGARGSWMSQEGAARARDRIFFRGWLPELDAYD